jgi:DNA-binding winged helix-turn-helix (wHTH) protein/Tol biopolymer transport system component
MENSTPTAHPENPEVSLIGEQAEYVFGPFRMDVASMQLWKGDQMVPLTPKAFDTLHVLIRHHNRLVRKEELLSAVWPHSFVSEDSLAQNITALRRSLADDHNQPQYIATVPRRGYRFIAPVERRALPDDNAAPVISPPAAALPATAALAPPPTLVTPAKRSIPIPVVIATMAALIGGAFVIGRAGVRTAETVAPVLNFTLDAPAGSRLASGGVLSPDGHSIAFVLQDEATGTLRIWVRALDTGVARMIAGTEGAARPFWSPDSQSLGFFATGRLKRIGINGGRAQTLASFVGLTSSGGSWSRNDEILFASYKTGLWSVAASGGKPTEVTKLDGSAFESAHRWPQFLPDGRHFLFSVVAEKPGAGGVFVGSLDSPQRVKVLDENAALYTAPGYLLFIRDRVLLAQAFDSESLAVTGKPVPIASDVPEPSANNNAVVSGGPDMLTFGSTSDLRLEWVNRAGVAQGDVKAPVGMSNPTLSYDQTRALVGNGTDIWLLDLDRDAPTRIIPGNTPLLSPDGQHIAYTSARQNGIADIFVRATSGPGRDELLYHSDENKFVNDWSRDSRYLVYSSLNRETRMDLWVLPRFGDGKPLRFLATTANEFQAQISPDGRWIAYASDESGAWEIYVQSFPVAGAKRAISVGGGSEPQWRRDGRELFYLAADGTLMAVAVGTAGDLQVSRRNPLFRTPIPISGEMYSRRNHYVPATDGQRFLMNAAAAPEGTITMVVNWRMRLPH